jgi:O-antigen ligase
MKRLAERGLVLLVVLLAHLVVNLAGAIPIWLLWNAIASGLEPLPTMTYVQVFMAVLLIQILRSNTFSIDTE